MKWVAVRVSEKTKAELERIREIWTEQGERCKNPLGSAAVRSGGESKRDMIGLDQVINRLILYWKEHGERRNRSGRRRAPRGDQAGELA